MVSPGTGIDLEFDTDSKYFAARDATVVFQKYLVILAGMTCYKITLCCTSMVYLLKVIFI